MKSAIIVFPGSNREIDMERALTAALERAGSAERPAMVWHGDSELPDVDLIVIPGGFSYGDYLRAGSMAAHSPAMREVAARAGAGVPTLGVCNGFQVLCEAGLLPGALMRNASLKFVCRAVNLRVERADTPFAGGYREGEVISVPVAHHDGNYFADAQTLDRLEQRGRIAFRYVGDDGLAADQANPNGSLRHIAGIYNETRTVLGLMPHPEDAVDPAHAGPVGGGLGGRGMFDGLVAALG